MGVYWGPGHHWNVSRPVYGSRHTNNVAEIQVQYMKLVDCTRAGTIRYHTISVKDPCHFGVDPDLRIRTSD